MSWVAAAVVGSAVIGAGSSYLAGEKAEEGQEGAMALSAGAESQARADITGQFDTSLQALEQGFGGGLSALREQTQAQEMERALSGALGPEAQRAEIQGFMESPGQQFLRGEQERALTRNAAAIGGLGGGRVRSALQEQALGRAATLQQQSLENLRSIAGRDLQTQANVSNLLVNKGGAISGLRTNYGSNLANVGIGQATQQAGFSQNLGSAQAAQALGVGSAVQQGIGGLANLYGQQAGNTLGNIIPQGAFNPGNLAR